MILKEILALTFLLKCSCEYLVDVYVFNGAVLEGDTEEGEFVIQVLDHSLRHFSLKVVHLRKPDSIDEVSYSLIDFSIKKFIESSSSEFVDKILNFIFLSGHSKGEEQVNVNVSIILGGTVVDWGIVIHDSLGEHAGNTTVTTVAPLSTREHYSSTSATAFL